MVGCPQLAHAAIRRARATWFVSLVGLALLSAPALAQSPDSTRTPPNPGAQAPSTSTNDKLLYAKMWTPRPRTGEISLHGGVFVPIEGHATSPTLGARVGLDLGSHVLLGIMGDWTLR